MRPVDPRLLRYARAARGFLAVSALIGTAQTLVVVAFAWLVTAAITGALEGRDVTSVLLALGAVALARGALIAVSDAAGVRAAARTGVQLRAALIAAVGRWGPGWLAQRNQSALAVTAGHGLQALDAYFARYIPQLVLTVIATPVVLAVMWWWDWPSALTATLTLPLIPLFLVLIGIATRTVQRRQWQSLQRLAVGFADTVHGLATLRLFGREQRAVRRVEETAGAYRRETMAVLRLSFLSGFAMELLASLAVALIAVSVGFRLLAGDLPLETGLFVLLLAPEAFAPIRQVGVQFHAAAEGVAATEDVFAVLDADADRDRAAGGDAVAGADAAAGGDAVAGADAAAGDGGASRAATDPRPGTGSILRVEALQVRELAPWTFTALPGTVTLLEGASGSGKSSLLAALRGAERFEGRATFSGVDVRTLAPSEWLAWAGQQPGLLRGTVSENVALGDPEPDSSGIRTALVDAGAGEIDQARELGVQGSGLSGGQAQRVAVARALYRHSRDPGRVLVLDEPSSALDAESEALLWRSLRRRADAGATVVLVSHRRSARDIADQVVECAVLA